MNKLLKNTSRLVSAFITLSLLLNACAPPQTLHTSEANNDFKIKQTSSEETESEIESPFSDLPSKKNLDDQFKLIGSSEDVPVTLSVKRNFPKNMSGQLQEISFSSVSSPIEVTPALSDSELKESFKMEHKVWKKWLDKYFKALNQELDQIHHEELKLARDEFESNYPNDKPDHKHQDKHNTKHDGKHHNHDYSPEIKKQFLKSQAIKHEEFLKAKQNLKRSYKQDRKNLEQNLKTVYKLGDDFSTKAIGGGLYASSLLQNLTPALSQSLDQLSLLITAQLETIIQSIFLSLGLTPPPLNLHLINLDQIQFYPRTGGTSYTQEPESSSVRTASNFISSSDQIIQNLRAFESDNPSFKALLVPFRAKNIFSSLKNSSGIPLIQLSGADMEKYNSCTQDIFTHSSDLQEDCDFALISQVNEVNWKTLFATNSVPQWLEGVKPENGLSHSLVITLNYMPEAETLGNWLESLLQEFYPDTYNSNKDSNGHVPALQQYAQDKSSVYFEVQSPESCEQGADLEISVPKIATVSTQIKAENVLYDGDYTFGLGFIKSSNKFHDELNSISVPKLSEKLNLAAHQRYDRAYQDSSSLSANKLKQQAVAEVPLLMADTEMDDKKFVGIQIENRTGNLFDLEVEKVGLNQCNLYYRGDCIDGSKMNFQFNTRKMDSGLYRAKTKYSKATDSQGKSIQGVNANKASENILEERHGYNFVVLNGAYSTYVTPYEVPLQSIMYADFESGINSNGGSRSLKDFKDSRAYLFFPPLSPPESPEETIWDIFERDFSEASSPHFGVQDPSISLDGVYAAPIIQDIVDLLQKNDLDLFSETHEREINATLKYNLLASTLGGNQGSFFKNTSTQLPSANTKRKYLNVGAVIDFSNNNWNLNHSLRNDENPYDQGYIPLKLQVVDPSGSTVYAQWDFNAKAGSQTIFQTYWKGNLGNEPSSYDYQEPEYAAGKYRIQVILDPDYIDDELTRRMYIRDMRNKYNEAYIVQPHLSQPDDPNTLGTSSNASIELKDPSSGGGGAGNSFDYYTHYAKEDFCQSLQAVTLQEPWGGGDAGEIATALNGIDLNNYGSWSNMEKYLFLSSSSPLDYPIMSQYRVANAISEFRDLYKQMLDQTKTCDTPAIKATAESMILSQELNDFVENNSFAEYIFNSEWIDPDVRYEVFKALLVAQTLLLSIDNKTSTMVTPISVNQAIGFITSEGSSNFPDNSNYELDEIYLKEFLLLRVELSNIFEEFKEAYIYNEKLDFITPNSGELFTLAEREQLLEWENRVRNILLRMQTIKDYLIISGQDFGGFSTQSIALALGAAGISSTFLVPALILGTVIVAGQVYYSLNQAYERAQFEALAENNDNISLFEITDSLQRIGDSINLHRYFDRSIPLFQDQYIDYASSPYVDTPHADGRINQPTGDHWESKLRGDRAENLPNWEPYDGGHHIVQKGVSSMSQSKTRLDYCFAPGSHPDQYNQSGIDSEVNIADLQRWFHASLHTKYSINNMNTFINDIFTKPRNKHGVCDLKSGDPCKKLEQFLKMLQEYLEDLNKDHKNKIEEFVDDCIRNPSGCFDGLDQDMKNIQDLVNAIDSGSKFFTRQSGPRAGKLEINRILHNKSVGQVNNKNRLGLTKEQSSWIKENKYKPEVESGNLETPSYHKKNMSLEDLCEEINERLKR